MRGFSKYVNIRTGIILKQRLSLILSKIHTGIAKQGGTAASFAVVPLPATFCKSVFSMNVFMITPLKFDTETAHSDRCANSLIGMGLCAVSLKAEGLILGTCIIKNETFKKFVITKQVKKPTKKCSLSLLDLRYKKVFAFFPEKISKWFLAKNLCKQVRLKSKIAPKYNIKRYCERLYSSMEDPLRLRDVIALDSYCQGVCGDFIAKDI